MVWPRVFIANICLRKGLSHKLSQYLERMCKLVCAIFVLYQASLVLGSCYNCTACNKVSSPVGPCKCDGSCVVFGDCCDSSFDLSTCEPDAVVPTGVEFVCRSIYPNSKIQPTFNEAFWMVSSCPDSWSTDVAIQAMIRDNCFSLSSSLTPVTDLDTGTVYANEFCAVCNGVESLIHWQPRLACTSDLYFLLLRHGSQQVLNEFPDMFQTHCQTCSYQPPAINTTAIPRPCFPTISTCVNKSRLEALTEREYDNTSYNALVDRCATGPLDIVEGQETETERLVFKNAACAECNGKSFYCADLKPPNKTNTNECVSVTAYEPSNSTSVNSPKVTVIESHIPVIESRIPTPEPLIDELCVTCTSTVLCGLKTDDCLLFGQRLISSVEETESSGSNSSEVEPNIIVELSGGYSSAENLESFDLDPEESPCGPLVLALLDCVSSSQGADMSGGPSGIDLLLPSPSGYDEAYVESLLNDSTCFDRVKSAPVVNQCVILNGGYDPGQVVLVGIPFTITFSSIGSRFSLEADNLLLQVDCPEDQVAVGFSCRPTLCPGGYSKKGGQCVFVSNALANNHNECLSIRVTLNSSDYIQLTNDTVLYGNRAHTIVGYNSETQPIICLNNSVIGDPINCSSGLVALNNTEFISLSNDTILFNGKMYDVVKYDDGRAIICPPNATAIFRNSTKFSYPVGYFILTYIGCSLSVVGCALVLLTYGLFKNLRTLPSLILMNLATAILANNLLIIIGGPVTEAFPSIELCTTVAVSLHFFFLAQFTWMVLMSFQMAKTFYQARKLISTKKTKAIFVPFFIIGWSIPLLITTVSIIVDFTTDSLVSYGVLSDGRLGSCWINHAESAIVAFIVPLVLIMIINLTLFIVVTVLLCLAAHSSNKVDKKQNLAYFRVNTAVFSVTGLTWIFGFIALLAGTGWAWYPFIIFNSTQGFVIFIAFLLTKHVLKLYMNLLLYRKDTVPSTKNKHLSSQNSGHKISDP